MQFTISSKDRKIIISITRYLKEKIVTALYLEFIKDLIYIFTLY